MRSTTAGTVLSGSMRMMQIAALTALFVKTSGEKTKRLLFVLNMTPVERKDYCVGVPEKKKYKLVLNSAEKRFGGSGEELKTDYTATAEPSDYKPYRITFDLPAYGALVFAF